MESPVPIWPKFVTHRVKLHIHPTGTRRKGLVAIARASGLKKHTVEVLEFLIRNGRGSVAQCQRALGGNRRTIQRDLMKLAKSGYVNVFGSGPTDPTRHYEPRR